MLIMNVREREAGREDAPAASPQAQASPGKIQGKESYRGALSY